MVKNADAVVNANVADPADAANNQTSKSPRAYRGDFFTVTEGSHGITDNDNAESVIQWGASITEVYYN